MLMGYKKKQISGSHSDLVYWGPIHNHKSWRERSLIPEILCLSLRLTIFLKSFFKPKEKLLKLNVIHSFLFLSLTVLMVHVYAWISLLYIISQWQYFSNCKSHTEQHVLLKRSLFFNDHYQGMSYFGKCDKAVNTFVKNKFELKKKMKIWVLFSFFCLSCFWNYYTIFFLFFSFLFAFYLHVLFRWYLFVIFYEINLAYHNLVWYTAIFSVVTQCS